MHVLLRPGPYVCAEWDFGGLPAFLLKDGEIELRSSNKYFMNRTAIFFGRLAREVKPFLGPQGPVVLVQIENEYGSWGSDHGYIQGLLDLWRGLIGDFEFYHADGYGMLAAGHVQGLSVGINGGTNLAEYQQARRTYPDAKLVFGGEIYPGWLTHWGEKGFQHQDKAQTLALFRFFVQNNLSFSMYMAHGGTNFAFTNGVNSPVSVHVTSYDYDAPINEQGARTPKYDLLREMFKAAVPWEVPEVPAQISVKAVPETRVRRFSTYAAYGSFSPVAFWREGNHTMGNWSLEQNDVPHGMLSYQLMAPAGNHTLEIYYADYAYVIIGGARTVHNTQKTGRYATRQFACADECLVEITVESQSHINYDRSMLNQRKGLLGIKASFEFRAMTMKITPFLPEDLVALKPDSTPVSAGYFYEGTLELSEITDTYLDMRQFGKGYLFVNGRNLGRFWNIGPQFRLYCPGVWLKQTNRVVVFDEELREGATITSAATLEDVPGEASQE